MKLVEPCSTPDLPPWNERRHVTRERREKDDARSAYAVDRDRIIHCNTFRELQHKTQVQSVLAQGSTTGFFRTRLNHAIETAQIARGLAAELGANADLVEAISLAHDLGHPPFGHAGERGLSQALAEHGAPEWNANVHSLVVVDEAEVAFVGFQGLDLTRATREGIARHNTPFDRPSDVGEFARSPNSGLESQIVDRADVMAYLAHDIDDALSGEYLRLRDLAAVSELLTDILEISDADWKAAPWPPETRALVSRRRLVATLIGRLIRDLVVATESRVRELGLQDPEAVRASSEPAVVLSDQYERLTRDLMDLLTERYYRSPAVSATDARASEVIKELFGALMRDAKRVPPWFRGESLPERVATYVASLNDLSAARLAMELGVDVGSAAARACAPS